MYAASRVCFVCAGGYQFSGVFRGQSFFSTLEMDWLYLVEFKTVEYNCDGKNQMYVVCVLTFPGSHHRTNKA